MRSARIGREIEMMAQDPIPGIIVWPRESIELEVLDVIMKGPEESPYENGTFKLEVRFPKRYPLDPPLVKFCTPVYHPNVDDQGRICLDSLKMPPKGGWLPALNVTQVLLQIRLLLSEPNPDDPLMVDISMLFKDHYETFHKNAQEHTRTHAKATTDARATDENPPPSKRIRIENVA